MPAESSSAPAGAPFQPRDPEAFARNLAKLYEEYGKAVAAYLAPREAGQAPAETQPDLAEDVVKTLTQVAETWLADPKRAVEAQTQLWTSYIGLWANSVQRMLGQPSQPVATPDAQDRRFRDPDWEHNAYFDFAKQLYLLTLRWAEHLVQDAEGLDEHTRHKAEFYVRQIGAALSPSNFLLTNPELLRETMASDGENLVRGMHLFAEDLKRGGGDLMIRQTDLTAFEVGRDLATTPGKVVFQTDLMQLIQYTPTTETVYRRPLVIVPPWINKFYILDLNKEKSFIKWLVDQGRTVFCMSWVNPDESLASRSFESYMRDGILAAVDAARQITGEDAADTMGYCVGGTLLAVTVGYLAATEDRRIASATFLTTQVDFTHAGDLKVFVDEGQLKSLEGTMSERGYLEGRRMSTAFNMLRPNDLIWSYFVNNYLRGRSPPAFDLLYWNSDATRMPAANHAFYLRHCYHENALAQKRMTIGGVTIDLSRVTIPIYNLATREDHIAPPRSVFVGSSCFGGPVEFVLSGSGHIAGVVNPPARAKYQFWTDGPAIGDLEDWRARAAETPGSWWPHWNAWAERLAPERVAPRQPGEGPFPALEDAPGSFVKVRS